MWYRISILTDGIQQTINNMDSQQWIVVSVIAIGIGAILLRGFGSRTSY